MDFSFESVGRFLQQVQGAKEQQRKAVEDGLEPLLNDPATFAIAPEMGTMIEAEVEKYGDEALRQLCIVTLGKWLDFHQGFLQEHIDNDAVPEALLTMRDISSLNTALHIVEGVGSFGGDEDYRAAMRKQINQAVLENIEETGRDALEMFNGNHDDELGQLL